MEADSDSSAASNRHGVPLESVNTLDSDGILNLPCKAGPRRSDNYFVDSSFGLVRAIGDTIASGIIFVVIQSWNSVLIVTVAVGSTLFYCLYDDGRMNAKLDFQFVSFAVVFPIVFFIGETWKRRETALLQLGQVRALSLWIYFAHSHWLPADKKPDTHVENVRDTLCHLVHNLANYLRTPRLVAREVYLPWMSYNAGAHIVEYQTRRRQWRTIMYSSFEELSLHCEALKTGGLPTNEASRLNQYNYLLQAALEGIMNVKDYRTPQGLRTFARFYVISMWPIMGPYFAWVKQMTGSLALAIMSSLFSSLALAGLISVALRLEDPFDGDSPDDIRVDEDLEDLQHALHKKPSVVGQKFESLSIYALPRHKLHH